jgi:transposase
VAELELSADLKREVRPLLRMFQALNLEIQRSDKAVESIVRKDVTVKRLCSVPGVGPVTAASFVATSLRILDAWDVDASMLGP